MIDAALSSEPVGKLNNVGSFIAERRKQRGLSQEALARLLNVSRNSVMAWESGKHSVNADNLPGLADALGVSIDDLYATGEAPSAPERTSKAAPKQGVTAVVEDYLASPRGQSAHPTVARMLREGSVFAPIVTEFGSVTWEDCDSFRQVLERRISDSGLHGPVVADEGGVSSTRALRPSTARSGRQHHR